MLDATCPVPGCEEPVHCRGYCKRHYMVELRSGRIARLPRITVCVVDECTTQARTHGMCRKHGARFERHGDPHFVMGGPDGVVRRPNWRGDEIAYRTVHSRLTRQRGPASALNCVDCGGPAAEWAYDHNDPAERVSDDGLRYSTDLRRYEPRCIPCHRNFDRTSA